MRWLLFLLVLTGACSEYEVRNPNYVPPAVPNPQELGSEWREDVWTQPAPVEVDIIFAIDQSCSMIAHRQRVADATAPMITELTKANVDYRVMITGTGYGTPEWFEGKPYATPDIYDPETAIYNRLNSALPDWQEKGIYSVYSALTSDWGADAFRVGVPLHAIVVSDEPDQTQDWEAQKKDIYDVFRDWETLKGGFTFNSIVGIKQTPTCFVWWPDPSRYIQTTLAFPGVYMNICAEDWSEPIRRITEDALDLHARWYLGDIPVPETIEVFEEVGQVTFVFYQDEDWTYDQFTNSIQFIEYKPTGKVRIKYELMKTHVDEQR